MTRADIVAVYRGSDGKATMALYQRLEQCGPAGLVALNLFRACKCSERAKVYRGGNGQGSYRGQAYERKQWSMGNLCAILGKHADADGIRWGWKIDPEQERHSWVLYVEIPTGQVSFHTEARGEGPEFTGQWDRVTGEAPRRICQFAADVLAGAEAKVA